MTFLNPIWLSALAALAIPVVIHLWNIRPGKTLKVGSIALMEASEQKSSQSVKLSDLLLLLLRCLLLVFVAIILSAPVWQRYINSASIKGWLLIPKESLRETEQKFKPRIDSLTKAGYEFHYFDKGFVKADLPQVLADDKNTRPQADSNNYWTLVQQLDGRLPASVPVYLFTPNSAHHFTGQKPRVLLNLHWQTYVPADSTFTWIAKAWLSDNNDVQVVQGNSKPSGTSYTNYTIRSGEGRNSPFLVNANNGHLLVGLKGSDQQVVADTSTWRFAIYADKNKADAGYVIAALKSIVQFARHKAVIKQYSDPDQIPEHQNWIFWLEQDPARDQYKNSADNFLAYETGNFNNINSWINTRQQDLSPQKIALYKITDNANDDNQPLWQDGFGRAILSLEKDDRYNRYHFYTRFNPAYNDLVWSDAFPKMLMKLIVPEPAIETQYDRRAMDAKQLMPVLEKGAHDQSDKIAESTNLSHYAWVLLVVIFILERWLAHKKTTRTTAKRILQNG